MAEGNFDAKKALRQLDEMEKPRAARRRFRVRTAFGFIGYGHVARAYLCIGQHSGSVLPVVCLLCEHWDGQQG